jgi:hypothetical protein
MAIQVAGSLAVLAGFALAQWEILKPKSVDGVPSGDT